MKRKHTRVLIVLLTLIMCVVTLCACNEEPTTNMIPFVLSDKTVDYFDRDIDGTITIDYEKEPVFEYVTSYERLQQVMDENDFSITPMYDENYFEDNSLVIYLFVSPHYGDLSISATVENSTLSIKTTICGIGYVPDALREWAFLIEFKNSDLVEIDKVELSNE